IIAFHQHMPAPLADSDHKEVDLEIARRLPLPEDFKDSFLGILVFNRRTLRAFEPADYELHEHLHRLSSNHRTNSCLDGRAISNLATSYPKIARDLLARSAEGASGTIRLDQQAAPSGPGECLPLTGVVAQ